MGIADSDKNHIKITKGKRKQTLVVSRFLNAVKWRRFGAFCVLFSALIAQNSCFQNVGCLEQEEEEDFTLFLLCGIQHGYAVTRKKCVFRWVEQRVWSEIKVLRFAFCVECCDTQR